jgi:DNA-binding NtrC family response regulator
MGAFDYLRFPKFQNGFKSRSLRARLLLGLIPPVVLILVVTGYVTYRASTHFIRAALEWSTQIRADALALELERVLETCREDLTVIAQGDIDPARLRQFLENTTHIRGFDYRGLAYISQMTDDHMFIVAKGGITVRIPSEAIREINPDPFTLLDKFKGLGKDEVWISDVIHAEYPFPTEANPNQRIVSSVIYFAMPYSSGESRPAGYLLLSLDIKSLRNALSIYSRDLPTPDWAYGENPAMRYSYVFNKAGWILFESVDPGNLDSDLGTDLARTGFTGILGSPAGPSGFRPNMEFRNYWQMVREVNRGNHGSAQTANLELQLPGVKDHFLSFAPVRFRPKKDAPAISYGGVAYVDRNTLTQAAEYKQIDIMFIVTVSTILVISCLIVLLSHIITKPILELTRKVDAMQQAGRLEPIDLPYTGYEISLLRNSINTMVSQMKKQIEDIRVHQREKEMAGLMEAVSLDVEPAASTFPGRPDVQLPGLLGVGTRIDMLRYEILKAARVEADILILGETGTGKQLAAEAIHRLSSRCERPFVSINCGELGETLLLDTLFGHTKGAFTEAKTERKGAFVEANGGILFLDEIQTASPAVQQALLRATAQRKIKPLGSDKDIDVDVRLIAATNADLKELVDQGKFRKDLYFRLKVITIQTPPLRDQRENIPLLVKHYLNEATIVAKKERLGLSRGAIEKMTRYSWPGNVRELINCIKRAVIMAEGPVIQADDIKLEAEEAASLSPGPGELCGPGAPASGASQRAYRPKSEELPRSRNGTVLPHGIQMNQRQLKAYRHFLEAGSMTRPEYQGIVGGDLPSRTAIYDLQDLVRKGLLKKTGKGPATRYVLIRPSLMDVSTND